MNFLWMECEAYLYWYYEGPSNTDGKLNVWWYHNGPTTGLLDMIMWWMDIELENDWVALWLCDI